MTSEPQDLDLLSRTLRCGLALSGQGSYQRRLPRREALQFIRDARRGLRELVKREPTAAAWRQLALAEEALLQYPAAVSSLENAIAISVHPDRKDLKRLVQLKEYAAKRDRMGISPEDLAALGDYLNSLLLENPCDRSLRHTKAWLARKDPASQTKFLSALDSLGGFCDCGVLLNVV